MPIMLSDVIASAGAEFITSGAITPATSALARLPMQACIDEAMPRRSGASSSASSVTTGTISAQPKENTASGSSAHSGFASNSRLSVTLTSEVANMIKKPCRT